MKQTKFFLFFILFSFCVSAQNSPGIDYFPHIGFFDFIVNFKSPPYGPSSAIKIKEVTEKNDYYFNELSELGLTNFVSDGQVHADSLGRQSPFRINDMGFSWKAETHNFNPSIYMNAIGHDKQKYPLEFGGTPVGNIEPIAANFGFVRPDENRTNYWSMTPGDLPLNIDSTGFDGTEIFGGTDIHFRGVRVATDEPGAMVWGNCPRCSFLLRILTIL